MTQAQLAVQMSGGGFTMHQTTIAKIEAGERPVTVGEAVALALVLGVDLTDLVTERGIDELAQALADQAHCQERVQAETERLAAADAAAADAQRRLRQATSDLIRAERKVESLRSGQDKWADGSERRVTR